MGFNAQPNLDNIQFRQVSGSTLILSGDTIINSVSGLSLTGDLGRIPIISSGESENYVLTYKSGKIVFAEVNGSGSGVYSGASPTTCTVGGLNAQTDIAGCSISSILESILVPTLSPTLTPNSFALSLIPNTTTFEVGSLVQFSACGVYNRGSVSPVYCSGPSTRTGLPISYNYIDIAGGTCTIPTTNLTNLTVLPSRSISLGTNTVRGSVCYSAGLAPKTSDGIDMTSCICVEGSTPTAQRSVYGVYPYFWGKSVTPPTANQTLINSADSLGNKCVASSSGNVTICNYNAGQLGQLNEYIWVAIPASSPDRVGYQGSNKLNNNGTIPGDAFGSAVCVAVNSPSSCWSNVSYKFYISNYPTSTVDDTGTNYCITYIAR